MIQPATWGPWTCPVCNDHCEDLASTTETCCHNRHGVTLSAIDPFDESRTATITPSMQEILDIQAGRKKQRSTATGSKPRDRGQFFGTNLLPTPDATFQRRMSIPLTE